MGQTSESKRGFAAMNADQQRQIASQGGKAAHEKGTAHEFTSEEARAAGRKGGEAVSQNREHMAEIGRKGAEARSLATNGEGRSRKVRGGSHEQQVKADEQPQQN
ncbi:KGG domain-containing protein [Sorangium sp. So ce128]|uniref:KGG domain-containing protein n=1 Tax=Sorangium sp. So ce128 TaxID=3133281 RepID=UPI003F643580